MPSKYFSSHYYVAPESKLIEDLYNEAIYIQGFTAYYIPNVDIDYDRLFGDDPIKTYDKAYAMDMYVVNSSYGETNDFFSKFGLEIRNAITIEVTEREFKKYAPSTYARPSEGDLVYVPFMRNKGELFEIKFVNTTKDLNVLARTKPFVFSLELEPFKYNDENINTGIEDIDHIEFNNSNFIKLQLQTGSGEYVLGENVYQGNVSSYSAIAEVSYWDTTNKILHVINTVGDFITTSNVHILGANSAASYSLITENTRYENTKFDNDVIHDEVMNFIESPNENPFGGLADYQ